jgi:hypothetical protein
MKSFEVLVLLCSSVHIVFASSSSHFELAHLLLQEPDPLVSCPADINGDGQINIGDLNQFLSDFGNSCNPGFRNALISCPSDLNGDGAIDTGDLLLLLGEFGNSCTIE